MERALEKYERECGGRGKRRRHAGKETGEENVELSDGRQPATRCISWMNFLLAVWQQRPPEVCFSLVYVLRPAGSIKYISLRQSVYDNIFFFPPGLLLIISLPPGIHNKVRMSAH